MAVAFAGPLSRWYARTRGDASALRAGVEVWRGDLRGAVADKVKEQLVWNEAAAVEASFDLGDAGWRALRLFALYAENAELDLPDTVPPLLELDPEWRAAADAKFATSKFGHLLACSVWLPGDFPVTFRVPMPDGEVVEVGSVAVLVAQLRWLNERTFQADGGEVDKWSRLSAQAGGELIGAARRGFWGLAAAGAVAVRRQVPIVVGEG